MRRSALAAAPLMVGLACGAPPTPASGEAGSLPEMVGASDSAAEALIAGWIERAGGDGWWDGVRDVRYTVTTVWYDADSGAERRRRPRFVWVDKQEAGYRVRVEREEPEGRYVQVWDGRRGWATLDGQRLADTAAAVVEIARVAGDLSYWIGLPWKLRDPGVRLRYHASERHGRGEVVEVGFDPGVGLSPGDRYWYYFPDDSAPLPAAVHFLEEGEPESARERTIWSAWRRAAGGLYVGERLYVDAHGRRQKALLFSDVVANAGVSDALFLRAR